MKAAAFHAALLLASFWGAGLWSGARAPLLGAQAAQSLREEARRAGKQARHAASLKASRRLLRHYPRSHIFLELEAEALRGLKNFRHEAAAWELYRQVAPFPATACPQLGRAYAAQGSEEKSLDAHRRCRALDLNDPDLSFYYGQALARAGRQAESEEVMSALLARSPGYHDAAIVIARARLEQGRLDEAEALLSRIVAAAPKHPDAWLVYGMLAREKGDKTASKGRLRKAVSASPAYADLYRVLGRWLSEDGDAEEAARVKAKLEELEKAP